ncbi:MAG: magnesium transporter CorA family protein [Actinomycetota bacterium]
MGEALTRVYRKGLLEAEGFPVADVSDYLEQTDTTVWVDFCGPTGHQLHELSGELGLHELAVEDAIGRNQRPKLDRYATHLFLSCRAVRLDAADGSLEETEVDAFVNQRWLITVRQDDGFPIEPVLERWDRSDELAVQGVSFLLYGLLDVLVDGYFDVISEFDTYYDEVSEGIFSEHPIEPARQRHWFDMRRAMVRFHRLVVPTREAVSGLMRREHAAVSEELYPYYQDVYDHILRVTEATDSLRDLISTIADTNLSLRDYRQNLIVKKVSSWAAIIAVPALITGYYGMNVPYPGSGRLWGVVASTALMLGLSAGLYVLFRRRDWL